MLYSQPTLDAGKVNIFKLLVTRQGKYGILTYKLMLFIYYLDTYNIAIYCYRVCANPAK
jgi:hypothetical protein